MSEPQVVIFGVTGDLARQKLLPALAHLAATDRPKDGFRVIGVARRAKTDDEFRTELSELAPESARADLSALLPRLHYQAADVSEPDSFGALKHRLDALSPDADRLYYLSLK